MADLDGTKSESKDKEYFTDKPQDAPVPMMKAVREVVHHNMNAADAFALYEQLKAEV